ncbi:MAG: sugar ABC transporter permease, partial [Nitratireductor sp.]
MTDTSSTDMRIQPKRPLLQRLAGACEPYLYSAPSLVLI